MYKNTVTNPTVVDINGGNSTTIVLNDENIVINITSEGIIIDFFDGDHDGEADGTIGRTFDEWRSVAQEGAV
jgi:hypothetical protein